MSFTYTLGEEDAGAFWDKVLCPRVGEWIEIRAIEHRSEGKGRVKISWANSRENFVKVCAYWNGQRHLYAGINPRKTRKDSRGGEEGDVARITGIPFDVDAKRAPGYERDAATDEELKVSAESLRIRLVNWLADQGFTTPYIDFSGNGYRVILLVDLPATPANFEKVRRFHDAANSAMGGVLDNISDPPRIIKIPGTWAIKGKNSPERPHRLSRIIQMGALCTTFEAAKTVLDAVKTPVKEPTPTSGEVAPVTEDTDHLPALVIRLRPCSRRAVEQGPRLSTIEKYEHENTLRLALVDEAYSVGIMKEEQIVKLFQRLDNYSEEKTAYEVKRKLRAIAKDGAHPYGCEAIQNHGGCLGPDCQLYGANKLYAPSAGVTFSPPKLLTNAPEVNNEKNPQLEPKADNIIELNSNKTEGGNVTPDPGEYSYLTSEEVDALLSTYIAEDYTTKRALFYGFLLNYTEDDQLNFAPVGPTSTGKSFLVTEVLSLFPEEDVITLGYASVKAFYHQNGYFETEAGEPLPYLDDYIKQNIEPWLKDNPKPGKGGGIKEWKESYGSEKSRIKSEWIKVPKTKVQNFHQKFLNFLDMNNMDLLSQLRPFISHDKKKIVNEITNKSASGRNATESITLEGYPTIIFCTVSYALDGQEQTRLIQLSPEISPKKLSESIHMISAKLKDRTAYRASVSTNEARVRVKTLIQAIKMAGIQQIVIPDAVMGDIEARFRKDHPDEALKPEHQREYPRLVAYVKASALFNMNRRDRTAEGVLTATTEDVDFGFELYTPLLASNEAGMPPAVYQFWMDSLAPQLKLSKYLKRQEVARLYFEKFKANIGEKALKALLALLFNAGLIVEDVHPEHGNVKVITTPDVDMEALRDAAEERKREKRRAEKEDDRSQWDDKPQRRKKQEGVSA
ncbi:MAG: hypothetical protein NTV61_06175 [Candidatus Bathyarchaeota archaeon]|nr:hypothetical protein [Candidatus Bathyarchaeota archaeon]